MRFPALFVAAVSLLGPLQAQTPDQALILSLRSESALDRHLPAPTRLRRTAQVNIVGQTAYITLPRQQPQAIYTSPVELKGALTSPDGRLVALVEGSQSTGDRPLFLHRIEQEHGARYIVESAAPAAREFVERLFESDPDLQIHPERLTLTAVKAHPANDFQFTLSGDNDLQDRSFTLIITEEAKPIARDPAGR